MRHRKLSDDSIIHIPCFQFTAKENTCTWLASCCSTDIRISFCRRHLALRRFQFSEHIDVSVFFLCSSRFLTRPWKHTHTHNIRRFIFRINVNCKQKNTTRINPILWRINAHTRDRDRANQYVWLLYNPSPKLAFSVNIGDVIDARSWRKLKNWKIEAAMTAANDKCHWWVSYAGVMCVLPSPTGSNENASN